jgi:hypothetical protein
MELIVGDYDPPRTFTEVIGAVPELLLWIPKTQRLWTNQIPYQP